VKGIRDMNEYRLHSLRIDLTYGHITVQEIHENSARNYPGESGIESKIRLLGEMTPVPTPWTGKPAYGDARAMD